jgi:site-specific recombinase XerC
MRLMSWHTKLEECSRGDVALRHSLKGFTLVDTGRGVTNQHIQSRLVREACDQSRNEWVASHRRKHISFVSNMLDLL